MSEESKLWREDVPASLALTVNVSVRNHREYPVLCRDAKMTAAADPPFTRVAPETCRSSKQAPFQHFPAHKVSASIDALLTSLNISERTLAHVTVVVY
jgi:hypothetical protein